MANLTTWIPDGCDKKESCPVLNDPEPDCYCLSLNSLDVPLAIQFCLRDFRECHIYKRSVEGALSCQTDRTPCT